MFWVARINGEDNRPFICHWNVALRLHFCQNWFRNTNWVGRAQIIFWSMSKSKRGLEENNKISSENKADQRIWSPIVTPLTPLKELRILDRGSIAILKRRGESRYPCLIRFVKGIVSEIKSGVTRQSVGDTYICCKKRTTCPEKPKAPMTLKSQEKLIFSNAFLAPSEMMAISWSGCDLAYSSANKTLKMFRVAECPRDKTRLDLVKYRGE